MPGRSDCGPFRLCPGLKSRTWVSLEHRQAGDKRIKALVFEFVSPPLVVISVRWKVRPFFGESVGKLWP